MKAFNQTASQVSDVDKNHKIPVREVGVRSISENIMGNLSAKQKLVISSRFGIGNGGPKTLEAIGKNLNITRERVRQIEVDAIKSMGKVHKDESFRSLVAEINDIVGLAGGLISHEKLLQKLFTNYFSKHTFTPEEARAAEILFLLAGLKKNKSNREIKDSWENNTFDKKYFKSVIEETENVLDREKKIFETEELLKKLSYGELGQKYPELKPEHVLSFLEVSKKIGRNVFGDWGKTKWPLINPRGVREKSTLVLMKKKKPQHFREISKCIEEMGLSAKKVHPQTVHNELIRDKRFVLVGRGTYALREWGYEEGTVKDVIIRLVKTAGGFLDKDKIYKGVLRKRKVKKATIAVNLADRKMFEKKAGGYKLKDTSL